MSLLDTSVRVDQNVTLFCTVTPADDLETVIIFMRRTGEKKVNCGEAMQFPDKCITNGTNTDYTVQCGSSTNNRTGKIKKYMLHIKKVKAVDFTEWWCQSRENRNDSNTLTLHETGK